MPMKKLLELLDKEHVHYSTISHATAYTAQQTAAAAHIPGKMLAKTVIIKLDGKLAMVVLPANSKVDLELLKKSAKAKKAEIASEKDFTKQFEDCEVGAMPPFGNLFGMEVYVLKDLSEDKEIAFNAGSHTELLQIPYEDFAKLVKPTMIETVH